MRAVSDYGVGNVLVRDAAIQIPGMSTDMAFPSKADLPYYSKVIAPDKKLVQAGEISKRKLINVKNLAVKEVWRGDPKVYTAPKNKRPKVVFHWGGGHQGANIIGLTSGPKDLAIKDSTFHSVVSALDSKYGKKKYDLHVVSGQLSEPIAFRKGARRLKEINKLYPQVTMHGTLSAEKFKGLLQSANLQVAVPGSTVAEIASLKGYKAPMLALPVNL